MQSELLSVVVARLSRFDSYFTSSQSPFASLVGTLWATGCGSQHLLFPEYTVLLTPQYLCTCRPLHLKCPAPPLLADLLRPLASKRPFSGSVISPVSIALCGGSLPRLTSPLPLCLLVGLSVFHSRL